MKRQILTFLTLIFLLFSIPTKAQKNNREDQMLFPLPTDPRVRYGKLDNGFTYYVRNNKNPEQQAEFYLVPDKKSFIPPNKENIISWLNEAVSKDIHQKEREDVTKSEEKVLTENMSLMINFPNPGKIKSQQKDTLFQTTNFVLSNGAKVIIKQTTLKNDEIVMGAISPGGSSLFPETNPVNIKLYADISSLGGLDIFSQADLKKILCGESISVSPTISLTTEGLSGVCIKKNFETMLQLIYLNFTSPRTDNKACQSYIEKLRTKLENRESDPQIALTDSLNKSLFQNLNRNSRLKADELSQLNYDTVMTWRRECYKNAGDFTFVFVGNIEADAVKPFLDQYLATLPSTTQEKSFEPVDMLYNTGIIQNHFAIPMKNPKTSIIHIYSGRMEPTLTNRIKMDICLKILNIALRKSICNSKEDSCNMEINGDIAGYPVGQTTLRISFDTNQTKQDIPTGIISQALSNLIENGPDIETFNQIKKNMEEIHAENIKTNSYWRDIILDYYESNYDGETNYLRILENTTPDDIKNFIKNLLEQDNLVDVMMTGY